MENKNNIIRKDEIKFGEKFLNHLHKINKDLEFEEQTKLLKKALEEYNLRLNELVEEIIKKYQ